MKVDGYLYKINMVQAVNRTALHWLVILHWEKSWENFVFSPKKILKKIPTFSRDFSQCMAYFVKWNICFENITS